MNDEALDIETKECVVCGDDIGWTEDNHEKPIEPVCYTCLEKRYYSVKSRLARQQAVIELAKKFTDKYNSNLVNYLEWKDDYRELKLAIKSLREEQDHVSKN